MCVCVPLITTIVRDDDCCTDKTVISSSCLDIIMHL